MRPAVQIQSDHALVRGLIHARSGRRRYVRVPTVEDEKILGTLTAGAALGGFTLMRMEDDAGMEILVATCGPVTLSFENRAQVASWLNHLAATNALGRTEARKHGPA